eukprot:jgi/Botrbrau1/1517/Bobra.0107s0005.1
MKTEVLQVMLSLRDQPLLKSSSNVMLRKSPSVLSLKNGGFGKRVILVQQ